MYKRQVSTLGVVGFSGTVGSVGVAGATGSTGVVGAGVTGVVVPALFVPLSVGTFVDGVVTVEEPTVSTDGAVGVTGVVLPVVTESVDGVLGVGVDGVDGAVTPDSTVLTSTLSA